MASTYVVPSRSGTWLTVVENHGDSHIRLLLKQPEAYGLTQNSQLVPMVLKAYFFFRCCSFCC